jgi:metal-responsive CopG/Arc/MetJ family transcriptional regulator
MSTQEKSVHKKKRGRGRPPGRSYRETIPVRLTEEAVSAVDAWISRQGEDISRSEAIRRLLDQALASAKPHRPAKRKEAP